MSREFDLRSAVNAVSDVVANRPPPLREFDQIYMKVADMVIQAHFISDRFKDKDVVFIGDGDAIGLSVMHLTKQGTFNEGPRSITVLDFDERIVNSINRFAEKYDFADSMKAQLYNVIEPLPNGLQGEFDAFYSNPPWGQSNGGESVMIFLERGIEATAKKSEGAIVIADDQTLPWTQEVLLACQKHASSYGYIVSEMLPELHLYHLDDNPNLRSCTCVFRSVEFEKSVPVSKPLDMTRIENFYGRNNPLKVKYVRENETLNYGKAYDNSYHYEKLGEEYE